MTLDDIRSIFSLLFWIIIRNFYFISTVPQAQPAASAPAPEHANGKQTTPQPVPTSIPGSIQDYKGKIQIGIVHFIFLQLN